MADESSGKSGASNTQIITAGMSAFAMIAVAALANWDRIFPERADVQQATAPVQPIALHAPAPPMPAAAQPSTQAPSRLSAEDCTGTGTLRPACDHHDRAVELRNDTSQPMTHFYASDVDVTDWQESLLGDGVIQPGTSVRADIDDGSGECLFDFKAVFADGAELVRAGVNVCRISEYQYSDEAPTES